MRGDSAERRLHRNPLLCVGGSSLTRLFDARCCLFHLSQLKAMAISYDGRRLMTAGDDGTINVWSVGSAALRGWASASSSSTSLSAERRGGQMGARVRAGEEGGEEGMGR